MKPAGLDHGFAIRAAEEAIERGSPEPLTVLTAAIATAVDEQLDAVLRAKKAVTDDDVVSGRRFVMSYIRFIHLAEDISAAIEGGAP